MFLIDLAQGTTFRLACAFAGFFGASTVVLFLFIYWQTAGSEVNRIDNLIAKDAKIVAELPSDAVRQFVETRVTGDFHRLSYAALFDAQGHPVAGNLDTLPEGLPPDGKVHITRIQPTERAFDELESVRAVERRLGDGELLVIGRNSEEVERLRAELISALELGLIPAMIAALAGGMFLSWRTSNRVKEVHRAAERIMRGHLRQRLPVRGTRDEFDKLSHSVNLMLDEIERLLDELKATGDEIAHDLRTPLTRVRARLENTRRADATPEELEAAIDKATIGLDQALAIITALLRIRELEVGRRRAGFTQIDLAEVVSAIHDLYQPLAEEKDIALLLETNGSAPIYGDHDLLIEAIGNLVDNAVKFTPEGGKIRVILAERDGMPVIRIEDNGPGIAPEEREMVFTRFYRSGRTKGTMGMGLGLSLVAAITRLHNISIDIGDNKPGCAIELLVNTAGSAS
ncbi:MAG TPA: ATP-binding protein [Aliidongia sp.]|nr:ATP-binding protein [Aliidongia sp.]